VFGAIIGAMFRLTVASPIGPLALQEEAGAVARLDWGQTSDAPSPLLREAARQLGAYFAGRRSRFDLPLAPAGTDFQRRVWDGLLAIPYGETRSYGQLADALGSGPRAVGGALGRNPIPVIVPCHRIVGAAGAPGGYSGRGGLKTKRYLLDLEAATARFRPPSPA